MGGVPLRNEGKSSHCIGAGIGRTEFSGFLGTSIS